MSRGPRAGKLKAPHDHRVRNHEDDLQPWCDTCKLSAGFQRPKPLADLFEDIQVNKVDAEARPRTVPLRASNGNVIGQVDVLESRALPYGYRIVEAFIHPNYEQVVADRGDLAISIGAMPTGRV